jgi:hypothetical protein
MMKAKMIGQAITVACLLGLAAVGVDAAVAEATAPKHKNYEIKEDTFSVKLPDWQVTMMCVENVAFIATANYSVNNAVGKVYVESGFYLCSEYNLAKLRKKWVAK